MQKWLIVADNAGGAEILSSLVHRERDKKYFFLLQGPALNVFSRKCGSLPVMDCPAAFSNREKFDYVLTGTSWGTDLELRALKFAKKSSIPSGAFLDHWTNYRERFSIDGQFCLPDKLWVGDEFAMELARNTFPGINIHYFANPYFLDFVEAVRSAERRCAPRHDSKERILFVSEPTSAPNTPDGSVVIDFGYDEFTALKNYLQFIHSSGAGDIEAVRVRRHPAEPAGKYDAIYARYENVFSLEESKNTLLAEDCAWADRVVGCDTMAMAVAVLAGKAVDSCIPRGGRPITLPFPAIRRLF